MTERTQTAGAHPADPCAIVIFGAAGDLTKRKLLPSLSHLARNNLLNSQLAIIGFAIDELDDESFRKHLLDAIQEFGAGEPDPARWEQISRGMHYIRGEFSDPG